MQGERTEKYGKAESKNVQDSTCLAQLLTDVMEHKQS
jgi:hypothetical protein